MSTSNPISEDTHPWLYIDKFTCPSCGSSDQIGLGEGGQVRCYGCCISFDWKKALKFEEVNSNIPMACGKFAISSALSAAGYRRPMLWVAPEQVGFARDLAREMGINYDLDNELTGEQWYVEWQGKRFGSVGI